MGYQIDPNRPTDEELRRVIDEQLTKAAAVLRTDGGSSVDGAAAHDVRKRLKKARSALRLGRADLGQSVRRQANDELRRSARALATLRDADAQVEALDALATHVRAGYRAADDGAEVDAAGAAGSEASGAGETGIASDSGTAEATGARSTRGQALVEEAEQVELAAPAATRPQLDRAVANVRAKLVARADAERDQGTLDRSTVLGVARSIEQTMVWLGRVPPRETGWDALSDGFAREYRRGRKALGDLPDEPTVEELHQWRKRAKDLWYHQRLLRHLWPEAQRPFTAAAHDLADRLGEDHDLALLEAQLTSDGPGPGSGSGSGSGSGPGSTAGGIGAPADGRAPDEVTGAQVVSSEVIDPEAAALVTAAAQRRRSELQAVARHLGALLYADRPGGFRDRHGAWWAATPRRAGSSADRPPASDNA